MGRERRARRRFLLRACGALTLASALALVFGVVLGGAGDAVAQSREFSFDGEDGEPIELTADRIEYETEDEVFVAEGNVRVVSGERSIRADWMLFSNVTHRGVASGNVVVVDGLDTLLADFIAFDTRTLRGVMFDGLYDTPVNGFRIRAHSITKTGDETYEVQDGTFTTCRCPDDPEERRPPWRIEAAETDIEVGGYGTARNTSFEILGVPAIWLPWMIYPVKTERESGLLLPEVNLTGRNGFGIGVPIFWAARHDVNVTLTPRWLTRRGFKPDLEVEAVWGERSILNAYASYVYDTDIDPDTPATPFGRNRWAFRGELDDSLPRDWRLRADVTLVSDNQYLIDFDDFPGLRINRYLESTAFLFRDFAKPAPLRDWSPLGASGLVASVDWADDLQNPDDQDRDDYLLQRLPELEWRGLRNRPRHAFGLVPSFDVDYTHFWAPREADDELPTALFSPDGTFLDTGIDALPDAQEMRGIAATGVIDPNRDNFPPGPDMDAVFEEGEPLARRGHRMLLYPRLARPLRLGRALEVLPEVGWQETLYVTDADFDARGLGTAVVDLRSRLEGGFDVPGLPPVRHVVQPRIGWAFVSNASQVGNPLFVPPTALPQERLRELDLWNVVRDDADRIGPFHGITFGVGNRFYAMGPKDAFPSLRVEATLLGSYRFDKDRFGLVILEGRTLPASGLWSRFSLGFDPARTRIDEGLFAAGWTFPYGIQVGGRYRYRRQVPAFFEDFATNQERFTDSLESLNHINQASLSVRVPLGMRWALTYDVAYSFDRSLLLANRGGVEYFSRCRCWAARVELSDDRQRGIDFKFEVELVGLGRNTPSFGTWAPPEARSFLDSRPGL